MSDTSYTARKRTTSPEVKSKNKTEKTELENFNRIGYHQKPRNHAGEEGWKKVQNLIGKWNASGEGSINSGSISDASSEIVPTQKNKKKKKGGVAMLVSLSEAIFGRHAAINSGNSSSLYLIVHYLLRLIVLVLCLIGCFAQIGTIMSIFFNYPAIVFVDLHPMEKLLLPSMTICNDNRVMRSKLAKYDATFAREWSKLINKTENAEKGKGTGGKGGDNSATSESAKLVSGQNN